MEPGDSSSDRTTESRPRGDHDISPKPIGFKASTPRKITTLNNVKLDLQELFECPVCMYPSILQCPNGHTLCSKCQSEVCSCPICGHSLGNIRCLASERVAESRELPCKFEISGCQVVLPFQSKLTHEQDCRFRPYNCPATKCPVTSDIPVLMAHLKNHHNVDIIDGSTLKERYISSLDLKNATWTLRVFNCFDHQFSLHFEAFDLGTTPVLMVFILFMGEESDARKFSYSLEVGRIGRRMIWEGVPRSIRDSPLKVRESLAGLIIQQNMAMFFSEGDGKQLILTVSGRICKNQA